MARQAWYPTFPTPSFANETSKAQRALGDGSVVNETSGSSTYSLQVVSSFMSLAGGSVGLAKTAAAGTNYALTVQPSAQAMNAGVAGLTKTAAMGSTPASSRQAWYPTFPVPTFANENSSSQRAIGGAMLNETPQTKAYLLSVSPGAMALAGEQASLSTHVANQLLSVVAGAMAIGASSVTFTRKNAVGGATSRFGLGLGLSIAFVTVAALASSASAYALSVASGVVSIANGTVSLAKILASSGVTLPTPAFGFASLIGWWDVNKSYTDATGATVPGATIDTVSSPTVSFLDDLSGTGNGFVANNKTNQPPVGPKGGPLFSASNTVMSGTNLQWLTGLSKFSLFFLLVPKAGTSTRTVLSLTEGATSVAPISWSVPSGQGSAGYAVGDYVTASSQFVVKSVDANGAILTVDIAVATKVSTIPSNPVAVTAAVRPNPSAPGQVSSPGTGASLNLVYPAIGSGSSGTRFSLTLSSGATGRKTGGVISPFDGTGLTIPSNGTSLGAPNGAALTDTTSAHSVGVVVDMTVSPCTATYYYDGVLDHSETFSPASGSAPWALNTSPATSITLGSNLNAELVAGAAFADAIAQARVTQLVNSWSGY